MGRGMRLLLGAFVLVGCVAVVPGASAKEETARSRRVSEVLSGLSLKHKVGQMVQLNINVFCNKDSDALNLTRVRELVKEWSPGSILNSPFGNGEVSGHARWTRAHWVQIVDQLQDMYVHERNGSGVKMVYGIDSVHGAIYVDNAAVFPQQINLGASFNPVLAEISGRITAKDTRLAGMHWAFAPILGIATQPKWPRVFETFGEDPHLASVMGVANIRGLQGYPAKLCSPYKVAACMKHFVGYPNPRTGRDRSPEWIPDRIMYQYYTPAFYAAIAQAQVATAMESYNEINGVPMVTSEQFLRRLLRDTLNFPGMTVTDWREIVNLNDWHMTAADPNDAVRLAMQRTTIDMSMVPSDLSFAESLYALVQNGTIPESRLDESVQRVLELKYDLGLLGETPEACVDDVETSESDNLAADRQEALKAVRESIVLLKNENGALPLDGARLNSVVLMGDCSNSLRFQAGGWTFHWQGALSESEFNFGTTILDGVNALQAAEYPNLVVNYIEGCNVTAEACDPGALAAAVAAAAAADAVVVCAGEKNYAEKPGNIDNLAMRGGQREMLAAVGALAVPKVLVLVEGRPRLLQGAAAGFDAVLHAFLPGPEGGTGIAEVLFGHVNPSGRMPITYPSSEGPVQYWHGPTDDEVKVEFEFGAGLSYTTFAYSDVRLKPFPVIHPGDNLEVSVTVTNTGDVAGKHVVLLYLRDIYRITLPEVKILKAFKKTGELLPGESVTEYFVLTCDDLAFVDVDLKWVLEPGAFNLTLGNAGLDDYAVTKTFTLEPADPATPAGAGDTIPWGMWGKPPGFQLPLAIETPTEHVPLPTYIEDEVEKVLEKVVTVKVVEKVIQGGAAFGLILAGAILGSVGTWFGLIMRSRAKKRMLEASQTRYLEMELSFGMADDNNSTAIAPAAPDARGLPSQEAGPPL